MVLRVSVKPSPSLSPIDNWLWDQLRAILNQKSLKPEGCFIGLEYNGMTFADVNICIILFFFEKKIVSCTKWLNFTLNLIYPTQGKAYYLCTTPFAVHCEKIRNLLRETATNSAKIHSLARKYEHLRINQIQLRFLHFNQHSITLLGIHMRHWAYKREKYTFIKANIKVINTILKVNRDN